jgi:hypothetical protein
MNGRKTHREAVAKEESINDSVRKERVNWLICPENLKETGKPRVRVG